MSEIGRDEIPTVDQTESSGECPTEIISVEEKKTGITWLSWGMFVFFSSFLYMMFVERSYFDQILDLDSKLKIFEIGRLNIYWLLWSKTMAVLLMLSIVWGVFHSYGWKRTSWTGFVTCCVLFYFLIVVDFRIYQSFGVHISTLLTFADEGAAVDAGGGGEQGWAGPIIVMFAVVTCLVGIGLFACLKLSSPIFNLLGGVRREQMLRRLWLFSSIMFVYFPYLIVELADHQMVRMVNRLFTVTVLDVRALYKNPTREWWVRSTDPRLKQMNRKLQTRFKEMVPGMTKVPACDTDAIIDSKNAPNVIIIALESFRFDVFERGQMPRLKTWAEKGLNLSHHYSNSSRTETGLFALTYARYPVVYFETLKALREAQMIRSFHDSGYETSFISAHLPKWQGMEIFLSQKTVDHAIYHDGENWNIRDKNVLADIKKAIDPKNSKPQWILAFLMSTHFEYQYPDEYEKNVPVDRNVKWGKLFGDPDMSELYNRYKNSLLFSDDLICDFIESIDLEKNIVVVTGDHSESFKEDGMFGHVGGLSDYQSRVPMVILGAGVKPAVVKDITQHVDLLPSLLHLISGQHVPVKSCHGRDIFSKVPAPNKSLLSNGRRPQDALSFVRNGDRLRITVDWGTDYLTVDGFENSNGKLIDRPDASQEEIDAWFNQIQSELYHLYR